MSRDNTNNRLTINRTIPLYLLDQYEDTTRHSSRRNVDITRPANSRITLNNQGLIRVNDIVEFTFIARYLFDDISMSIFIDAMTRPIIREAEAYSRANSPVRETTHTDSQSQESFSTRNTRLSSQDQLGLANLINDAHTLRSTPLHSEWIQVESTPSSPAPSYTTVLSDLPPYEVFESQAIDYNEDRDSLSPEIVPLQPQVTGISPEPLQATRIQHDSVTSSDNTFRLQNTPVRSPREIRNRNHNLRSDNQLTPNEFMTHTHHPGFIIMTSNSPDGHSCLSLSERYIERCRYHFPNDRPITKVPVPYVKAALRMLLSTSTVRDSDINHLHFRPNTVLSLNHPTLRDMAIIPIIRELQLKPVAKLVNILLYELKQHSPRVRRSMTTLEMSCPLHGQTCLLINILRPGLYPEHLTEQFRQELVSYCTLLKLL